MPIEIKATRIEGSLVHVDGLVDGKLVRARGAAYPYRVGKTPEHKRRYLEQLLTAALTNETNRDEPASIAPPPGGVNLPGSFLEVIDALKRPIEDHEKRIRAAEDALALIKEADALRNFMLYRTFWHRLRWILTGK